MGALFSPLTVLLRASDTFAVATAVLTGLCLLATLVRPSWLEPDVMRWLRRCTLASWASAALLASILVLGPAAPELRVVSGILERTYPPAIRGEDYAWLVAKLSLVLALAVPTLISATVALRAEREETPPGTLAPIVWSVIFASLGLMPTLLFAQVLNLWLGLLYFLKMLLLPLWLVWKLFEWLASLSAPPTPPPAPFQLLPPPSFFDVWRETPVWTVGLIALGALLAARAGRQGLVVTRSTLYGSLVWLLLCAVAVGLTV